MRNAHRVASLLLALAATGAIAAEHDPKVIVPLLARTKLSLVEGIERAEKTSGVVTSAKFEVEDGKLILSVYTVPEGLGVEPEKATLTELAGVATVDPYAPTTTVFPDKAHIARAAVHMTLFQLSPYSLRQVVDLALKKVPGVPIDVRNPLVRNRRPVADVVIVDASNRAHTVSVDLLSGSTDLR